MKNELAGDELVAARRDRRSSRRNLLYLLAGTNRKAAGRPIKNSRPRDKSGEKNHRNKTSETS